MGNKNNKQQQPHKLYLYDYCSYSIAIAWKTVVSQSYNLYNGMITMVNQVSSV